MTSLMDLELAALRMAEDALRRHGRVAPFGLVWLPGTQAPLEVDLGAAPGEEGFELVSELAHQGGADAAALVYSGTLAGVEHGRGGIGPRQALAAVIDLASGQHAEAIAEVDWMPGGPCVSDVFHLPRRTHRPMLGRSAPRWREAAARLMEEALRRRDRL